MEEVKSLEDFNKMLAARAPKPSIVSFLVISMILPPLTLIPALYMANKKNLFDPALAIICAAYSITYILLVLQVVALKNSISAMPELTGGYLAKPTSPIILNTLIILCVLGIGLGIFFRFKFYKDGSLPKYAREILLGIIALQSLFSVLIIGVGI